MGGQVDGWTGRQAARQASRKEWPTNNDKPVAVLCPLRPRPWFLSIIKELHRGRAIPGIK